MPCSDSKYLAKRTISDRILRERAYKSSINPKYNGYQRRLESMVYNFFDKKIGLGVILNEELAHELHKPVIKKFKRRKAYVRLKDNIWATDLTQMGSLSSFNSGLKYLLV